MTGNKDYIFIFNKECLKHGGEIEENTDFDDMVLIYPTLDPLSLSNKVISRINNDPDTRVRKLIIYCVTDMINKDQECLFPFEDDNKKYLIGIHDFIDIFLSHVFQNVDFGSISDLEVYLLCVETPYDNKFPPKFRSSNDEGKLKLEESFLSFESKGLKSLDINIKSMRIDMNDIENSTKDLILLKNRIMMQHTFKSWDNILNNWKRKEDITGSENYYNSATSQEDHHAPLPRSPIITGDEFFS